MNELKPLDVVDDRTIEQIRADGDDHWPDGSPYVIYEEKRERRRIFFAAMRHPEMRLLRTALWDLKWEHNVPWENITKLEMDPYSPGCCMIIADHHMSVCLDTNATHPYFHVMRLHDADDPLCECEDCQDSRLCYIRCKDVYIEQASA